MSVVFIVAQAFGVLAIVCFCASFNIKSNRMLFIFQGLGCMSLGIQYLLLGAYSGFVTEIFLVCRNLLLSKYNSWAWVRSKVWVLVFSAISIAITVFTWKGLTSILPAIAVIGGTVGMWTNKASYIRLANLTVVSPIWLIYDLVFGAYTAALNETILIVSIIVSIIRYGWSEMADPDSDFQKK